VHKVTRNRNHEIMSQTKVDNIQEADMKKQS